MADVNKLIGILNRREMGGSGNQSDSGGDPKPKVTKQQTLHPQIQEKIEYTASPIYKRRLMALGESKSSAEKLIRDRINVLKNIELRPYSSEFSSDGIGGGQASNDPKTNRPYIAFNTNSPELQSTFAHELAHITSGVERSDKEFWPEYNESVGEARKRVERMLSEGTPQYMSPKEALLFNLQNKNMNDKNWALPGSAGYKMTQGRSLNDYFYNKDQMRAESWPLGTRVNVEEPSGQTSNFINGLKAGFPGIESVINKNVTVAPLKTVQRTMDLTSNPAYTDEFFKGIHDFNEQGLPSNKLAKTSSDIMYGKYDPHVYSPKENKADLDAIRYLLKKYNYTGSYGDDITPELWQKAIKDKRLNNDSHFQRMRQNFSDKAIINLNNRVAKNQGQDKNKNQV
jgi:hypothetical protein